jgi:hypothetical protein
MDNAIKKWINSHGKMIAVLYIVLIIIILFTLLDLKEVNKYHTKIVEGFSVTDQVENILVPTTPSTLPEANRRMVKPVHNILVSLNDPNIYYGAYLSYENSRQNIDNFIYTNSLASNEWLKPTENLALSESHVIIDLTYDTSKRLTAVGLKMNESGKPEYDIFKKKTSDFKSEWIQLDSNKVIRSLCNDLKDGSLLGCSSYDGQIYSSQNRLLSYGDWYGPINYDVPMRKVMFDKEGYMVGIGLVDNYIYRKKTKFWKESKWNKKDINKTKVFDLIYDTDGCFIATTLDGIKKQSHPDFNSEFVLYRDFNEEHDDVLDLSEIIKFKTGNEFLDDDFDLSTELGRDLKRIYAFKKISKDLCGNNKVRLGKGTVNNNKDSVDTVALSAQNNEINELYDKVDELTKKLGM